MGYKYTKNKYKYEFHIEIRYILYTMKLLKSFFKNYDK